MHVDETDEARFAIDDLDDLVAASFTCPLCLRTDTEVVIGPRACPPAACSCRSCTATWTVALSAMQVVRLAWFPPIASGSGWRVDVSFAGAVERD